MLLPLSSSMNEGELDHGGGGGGGGGLAAAAAAAVGGGRQPLAVNAAGKESADGRMMACNDESGRLITTQ